MERKEERQGLLKNLQTWIDKWFDAFQWKDGEEQKTAGSPTEVKQMPEGIDLILLEGREDWFRIALTAPMGVSLQTMAELCADLGADGVIVFGDRLITVKKAVLRARRGRFSILAEGRYLPFFRKEDEC